MNTDRANLMISREFSPSKLGWLALAIKCLENADMVEGYVSLEVARNSMKYALEAQIEANESNK